MTDQVVCNVMNVPFFITTLMSVLTEKEKGKAMQLLKDDSHDSHVEKSDNKLTDSGIFTVFVVFADSSCEPVLEIPDTNDEKYNPDENKDIYDVCNNLFEILPILKKQNMKLTKKIKF